MSEMIIGKSSMNAIIANEENMTVLLANEAISFKYYLLSLNFTNEINYSQPVITRINMELVASGGLSIYDINKDSINKIKQDMNTQEDKVKKFIQDKGKKIDLSRAIKF